MTSMVLVTLTTIVVIAVGMAYGAVLITTPEGDNIQANVDENVNLICSNPLGGDLEWVYSDSIFGDIILEDNPPKILTASVNNHGSTLMLTIEGTMHEDAGDYMCRSVDDPADGETITLFVHDAGSAPPGGWVPPKIDLRDGQESMEIEAGKEINLKCVGGTKSSDLQIQHNGETIIEDTHNFVTVAHDVNQDGATLLLTRQPATTDYSGTYTCFDPDYPDHASSVEINVVEHPSTDVELIEPSGSQSKVMLGDNFNFKCQSSYNTEVIWYHDDEIVENEVNGFIILHTLDTQTHKRITVLSKDGAEGADAGTYRCSNAQSPEKEASIVLAVMAEGDDGGSFLDDLFGAAPYVTSSLLLIIFALASKLI